MDIWACGGGANGGTGGTSSESLGGAGAYCAKADTQSLRGDYIITVGGAGGNTSVGSLINANGSTSHNGGTGGGAGNLSGSYEQWRGKGDGIAKYPFEDTANFKCHCAGGGGGGVNYSGENQAWRYNGGNGGTNGGNGA